MSLPAGMRVGQFEIAEPIGAGGMGEVFRARDHVLRRDVAIKILPAAFASDPERRLRLTQEARLLAALNHPHVAQVFGIEETAAGSAIVMELVPGETLRDAIRARPIGVSDAVTYARQIAQALDAAHDKGIVHRDLKPANVKITPEGAVKVLDFGLAKAYAADVTSPHADTTMALPTGEGTVVGTIGYMSPEQARGQPVDRRTDIWAFGCVLFELFSGRPPFDGATASDTIAAVLERDPDWRTLRPDTPPRIHHLIRRCLEKDRRRRLRDIGDALPDLDEANAGTPAALDETGVRRAHAARRWRTATLALGVLAIALAVTIAWLWRRSETALPTGAGERPVRFGLPPPAGASFGSSLPSVEATTIAFSPDGTRLAFIATPRDKPPQIWIRELEAVDARPVAGTEYATSMFWSPDGRSLGFFASGKLRRIDQGGGAAVHVCDVPQIVGLSGTWGADGQILFGSIQGDGIFRVSSSGGTPAPAILPTGKRQRVLWPRFLPDGHRILYTWLGQNLDGEIVLVEQDGRERPLVPALSQAQFIEPDVLLFVREGTLVAQRVDLPNAKPAGEPIPVIGLVGYSAATGWSEVTASANGMLAAQTHRDVSRLAIVGRSGQQEGTVGAAGEYLSVSASPDGSALLFSRLRPELGTYDIWSTTLPRQSETAITTDPGAEIGQIWVPGMREIVLVKARGGPPNLFLRDLRTGNERRLAESSRMQFPTDVSPDGKTVAYQQRTARGNWDLMQLELREGAQPVPLMATPFTEAGLRFSPRGDQVAFISDQSGRFEVYVAPYPLNGAATMVSAGGGSLPRWRRDGRGLYFLFRGKLMAATVDAGGNPGTPTPLFDASWNDFDVMAGERFVAVVGETRAREQPLTILLNWRRVFQGGRTDAPTP